MILIAAPSFAQTATTRRRPRRAAQRLSAQGPRPAYAAELKTATYVRDVIYGHRDGMALTYDVFKPVKNANGALVVNMVSAGWRSSVGPAGGTPGALSVADRQGLHGGRALSFIGAALPGAGCGRGRPAGHAPHQAARRGLWR